MTYYLVTVQHELFGVYKRKWQAEALKQRMLACPVDWSPGISIHPYTVGESCTAHPDVLWLADVRVGDGHFGEIK